MSAIAGQTAEPNGLQFLEGTLEYLRGDDLTYKFFFSKIGISFFKFDQIKFPDNAGNLI